MASETGAPGATQPQNLIPEELRKEHDPNNKDVLARDPTYFHYYSLLTHQQNMLQDAVRTSTYQRAILQNPDLYMNKLVMDVGAGSGILSYFAVQAGASVIAIEASNMALKMNKLIAASALPGDSAKNPWLKDRIQVINKKIEDVHLPCKVDTIISEPIGVMLVHERMLESFIVARDRFLKPGGAMVPSQGSIYLCPFTDAALWSETMSKARFWEQTAFYGVDLTPLRADARDEMFSMPVVGYFDANSLMATPVPHEAFPIDFNTITLDELKSFRVPFSWVAKYTGVMHGLASWFDLFFTAPPSIPADRKLDIVMSTGPHAERTHWQQARLLLNEPLAVNVGQVIRGWLDFNVNTMRSYDISGSLELLSTSPSGETLVVATRTGEWGLQEQTYNYSYLGPLGTEFKPEQLGLYESLLPSSNADSFSNMS
ncbi:hypothetical protein DSO57_1011591 [Entomophthora muscae]|uniref:Uncharacterized protein n=2 Tax=Entomophthora muscae TaxID=34485 RepID=A0ACC2TGU6_9FUNG|nr:hypothetical protein DSO57_1011591 [Entomophthora muscae]